MFDIGWSEMAVIALIALVVIGPKDLPNTMKTIAHWMRKARSLTREFQSGIDDMVRDAELEDARKALDATRGGNLKRTLSNALDPDDEVGKEVRAIEQDARREDGGDKPAAKTAEKTGSPADSPTGSNADKAAAKMVTQPASPAPPHSLKPAGEPAAEKPAGDDSAEGKSASEGSKQSA